MPREMKIARNKEKKLSKLLNENPHRADHSSKLQEIKFKPFPES